MVPPSRCRCEAHGMESEIVFEVSSMSPGVTASGRGAENIERLFLAEMCVNLTRQCGPSH